jgi:hypothetical protein
MLNDYGQYPDELHGGYGARGVLLLVSKRKFLAPSDSRSPKLHYVHLVVLSECRPKEMAKLLRHSRLVRENDLEELVWARNRFVVRDVLERQWTLM